MELGRRGAASAVAETRTSGRLITYTSMQGGERPERLLQRRVRARVNGATERSECVSN